MDIVVENGTGLPTANAYCSADDADDILSVNPQSKWPLLDEATKENLLIWATRLLDQRCRWNGRQMFPTSGTAWPRSGVRTAYGIRIDDNLVPKQVKTATALLAEHLIAGNPEAVNTARNVTEIKVDVIDIRFDSTVVNARYPQEIGLALAGLGTMNTGRGFKRIIKS